MEAKEEIYQYIRKNIKEDGDLYGINVDKYVPSKNGGSKSEFLSSITT